MRIAVVDANLCVPEKCDFLCKRVCPRVRAGEDCISIVGKKPVIDEDLCVGCGICVHKCPTKALQVVNTPEELRENPVHRFGKNGFALFRLPVPKHGKVIGLIGKNGIGKTTAMRILAGQLIPNLNNLEKEPDKEAVIKHHSKEALGNFFKKLYKGMKVAYKPQRIELLPKLYSGKVRELLAKGDEKGVIPELIERFGLGKIVNRQINKLSGGELQLIAIAATAAKDANFYFFDEPASFCDITARMKVARVIRELAKHAAVMVVEHDIATLDYLSDEIEVIYGVAGCFGIVSRPMGLRRGINQYLDGYLQDENVRFREQPILFSKIPESREVSQHILLSFPAMQKKIGGFSLDVESGEIHEGEILALVGANGLGKTTFLRMLAGKIKPDIGMVEKIKVAYKPQYPVPLEGTVAQMLKKAVGKRFTSSLFKSVISRLGIDRVLEQEFSSLSGGELQKVWIISTLFSQAKLILLDEPSAFIDVEDRLLLAGILRNFVEKEKIAALVIDHDVQFIDAISHRLLVFTGVPGKCGKVSHPMQKRPGMNLLLHKLDITYRRDKSTKRPRINKPGSRLDQEQRRLGEYYYA